MKTLTESTGKRIVLITVLTLLIFGFTNSVQAQQILLSADGFKTPMQFGDHVEFTITNNSQQTVGLMPRYWEPGMEDIFQDSANLISSVVQAGAGSATQQEQWLKMTRFVVHLFKSYNFNNRMEWWSATDSNLMQKQYNLMGFIHGVYFAKCGDFAQMCCEILIDAGIPSNALRVTAITGHTIFEINLGTWVAVDADRTPFCITPDTLERSGFASTKDEQLDTALFTNSARYLYGPDSVDLSPLRSNLSYQVIFDVQGCVYNPAASIPPLNVSSHFKLCPGCSLRYAYTETGISIDMGTQTGKDLLTNLLADENSYIETTDSVYLNDYIANLSAYSGRTLPEAINIFNRDNILNYKNVWYPHYSDSVPTLDYIIPPVQTPFQLQPRFTF